MDYEKRYKEAIERAKDCLADGTITSIAEKYIKAIFPELKENEDERIRKEICKLLWDNAPYEEAQEYIAWLEKQGEQKHTDKVESKFKIGDTVTVKPMSCHGKVFKGKPFKIVDIIEDNYVSDDGKTYSISLQDGWELVEQKPAWSEEDEDRLKSCLNILQAKGIIGVTETINTKWLKSLKDRYTWKPSDEQMEALESATENCAYSEYQDCLRELMAQLEKLKY